MARLPLLAPMFGRELAAGVARSMALLLDTGVSLPQALRLSAMPGLANDLDVIARRVDDGEELAEALTSRPWLSRWLRRPAMLGKASGDLSGSLREAADQLRSEADRLHDRTLRIVKTLLHLTTTLLVAGVVFVGYHFIISIPGTTLELR